MNFCHHYIFHVLLTDEEYLSDEKEISITKLKPLQWCNIQWHGVVKRFVM